MNADSRIVQRNPLLLHFRDESLEEAYIEYLHPQSLMLLTVLYTAVGVGQLLLVAAGLYKVGGLVFTLPISAVLQWGIHLAFKYKKAHPGRLLMCERGLLIATAAVAILLDVHDTTEVYTFECDTLTRTRIDPRLAYHLPQCQRYWSPFPVGVMALVVSLRITRHQYFLLVAASGIVMQIITSLAYDVPDKLFQLYLASIFLCVSFAFVCFVQRQLELEQRNQFLEFRFVVEARQQLQRKNEELLRLSENLVPATILGRLQSHDPMLPRDVADDAVVLVAGVFNFGVWCTEHRPIDAAVRVGTAHDLFRKLCRRKELDVIGGFGDTIAAVGNLIQPLDTAAVRACTVADLLRVEPALGRKREFPLCQVVDGGRLEGGFVGTKFVRYDVFGEPYDAARAAVHDCLPGELLASPYIRAQLSEGEGLLEGGRRDHGDEFTTESNFVQLHLTDGDRQRFNAAAGSVSGSEQSFEKEIKANHISNILSMLQESKAHLSAPESATSGPLSLDDGDNDASGHFGDNGSFGSKSKEKQRPHRRKMNTKKKAEELEERYQALTTTKTVWCCFKQFADAEVEAEYHRVRIGNLRHAASLAWFAYAAWVACVFCILLVDLETHRFPLGAILLIVAVLLSVLMAVVPRVLASEAMERWFFVWSVTGIWLPLLTVFGCALSRPAAVGNDVRLYMLLGAMVRVHCFTSSRWQVVIVPITIAVGATSYLLPGAYLRSSWPIMLVVIGVTVAADWSRDQSMREALRRRVEAQLVNNRLDSTTRLLEGLHRGLLPAPAFELIYAQKEAEAGIPMFNVGVLSSESLHRKKDHGQFNVFEDPDACVAIIRCGQWQEPRLGTRNSASSDSGGTHSFDNSLTGSSTSGSHQPYVSAVGSATSRSEPLPGTKPSGFKAPFDALETAVAASKFISIASILGDQAVVVGPVRLNRFGARRLATTEAFEEIFMLCTQLPNLASTTNVHFGAIIDVDSVAHIVRSGDVASYSLLGVATTRLSAVADGMGITGMAGTLLTDRAMKLAEAGVMLNGLEVRPNGPVKVRGAGVVRLLRVSATLPHVELMENVSNASSCL